MSSSTIAPKQTNEDENLDLTLRPRRWNEYIGQETIKNNLKILIQAAQERGDCIEHLLFYGPPGLGKTTIAHLISKETGSPIKITSGPAIERVGDLASLLTNLSTGDILFIDEIHRLNKTVEEILYPAMENRSLDIIIGKGPSARSIQLELPAFTLIGATTRISLLSSPLRSRFSGGSFRLNFYNQKEMKEIVSRSAKILKINLIQEAAEFIADRSRCTPRVANRLLKRVRDYSQVNKITEITVKEASAALKLLEIDEKGLEAHDRQILKAIIEKFNGGPVGVKTIAASLSEEAETIEEVYEPYLIQLGFIERTSRGRLATPQAFKHLGKIPLKNNQPELL
ncbi:MAG: Holliday junction branch migration DNA helicase RuvB [Candidatus Niyogibacteria bacterium]|nr:Holliday junction branch migration DNA helicase RuvB [Candidatus Niyogibacteria bacterium]